MIKLKDILLEKTVKLSTMKDANFGSDFVQLMGKKGYVKLDKKSVHKLAKIVRQLHGKGSSGMGWSFTMGEGKLTEDFKNNEWEVYVADEKGREKIVKVAKSKRAGVILYNKLINTDKYHEVGMRVIKEGKLTESSPYKTASRNELAMYISQLSTTIKNTKDRKMLNMLKKDKKEVEKELKSRKRNEGKLTEAETMKLSDVWKDYVKKYGKNKAAEKLMDILTMGAWASWDGDRIKRFKKEIIKKFSKFMKEGKLNEGAKVVRLPNGVKVKIDFKGLTFIGGTKPVFLDRTEMEIFFNATARYLK
jgi:hypothetical protein